MNKVRKFQICTPNGLEATKTNTDGRNPSPARNRVVMGKNFKDILQCSRQRNNLLYQARRRNISKFSEATYYFWVFFSGSITHGHYTLQLTKALLKSHPITLALWDPFHTLEVLARPKPYNRGTLAGLSRTNCHAPITTQARSCTGKSGENFTAFNHCHITVPELCLYCLECLNCISRTTLRTFSLNILFYLDANAMPPRTVRSRSMCGQRIPTCINMRGVGPNDAGAGC